MNKLHYALCAQEISVDIAKEVVSQLNKDGKSVDSVQLDFVKTYKDDKLDEANAWGHMTIYTRDYLSVEYFMETMYQKTSLDMSGRFHFFNNDDELQWLET
jgi:hypothetical protein